MDWAEISLPTNMVWCPIKKYRTYFSGNLHEETATWVEVENILGYYDKTEYCYEFSYSWINLHEAHINVESYEDSGDPQAYVVWFYRGVQQL